MKELLYVSPRGNDANEGSEAYPLRTVDAAVRKIGVTDSDEIEIRIAPGEYRTPGIVLPTGTKTGITFSKWIKYACDHKKEAVINGGIKIAPDAFCELTADEKKRLHGEAVDRVRRVNLRELGLGPDDWGVINAVGNYNTASHYSDNRVGPIWCELFVNDKRMELARYPDEGYLHSGKPVREGDGYEAVWSVMKHTPDEWAKMRDPLPDIFEIDADTTARVAAWKTLDDVWMFGYPQYDWADASWQIKSFDPEAHTIEDSYVSLYGIRERIPYYFFNVFEELDAPGEWYLDRESGWMYLYAPGELSSANICLSLTTEPIFVAEQVSGLTLRGLTFVGTRGDALHLSGDGITVDGCKVRNVSGNAIILNGNHCTVQNCEICHMGRGGIHVGGGDRATLTPSGNLVTNNHIHHIGEIYHTYQPGVALGGCGNVCSHNLFHDAPHMVLGYSGNDHVIEYNEIHHVCLNADDAAAIYAGRDYTTCGNVIRYNFIHDLVSSAEGHGAGACSNSTYCDDNLGKTTFFGNVYLRCQMPMAYHGGHEIDFCNNLVVDAQPDSPAVALFYKYCYPETLKAGGTHLARMKEVPWQSEIWRKKYPHLAEYLTWDPETEQCYPHYCHLTENIIVRHKSIVPNFEWDDPRFHNQIANNPELSDYDGVSVSPDGTLTIDNDRLCAICPGFEPIPFEKIGLYRDAWRK